MLKSYLNHTYKKCKRCPKLALATAMYFIKGALFAVVLNFIVFSANAAVAGDWSYSDQEAWKTNGNFTCDGTRQSPINIVTNLAESDNTGLISLELQDSFDKSLTGEMDNTGTTIKFTPNTLDISWTNHLGSYVVQQFHFHWGRNRTEGSEHTVDGEEYAAEIHFVSLKEGLPGNSTDGDAYSVVGVFCEEDDSVSENGIWSELMVPKGYQECITINETNVKDLLPENLDYYYYEGSLTTPPCTEVVQWFVLKNPIKCPSSYVRKLRDVDDSANQNITYNFREPQAVGQRVITEYKGSDGFKTTASVALLLLLALIASLTA